MGAGQLGGRGMGSEWKLGWGGLWEVTRGEMFCQQTLHYGLRNLCQWAHHDRHRAWELVGHALSGEKYCCCCCWSG